MQQIAPQISEEIKLEHQDKSNIIAHFGTCGPTAFCCKEENRHFFSQNVCSKDFFPIETAMEKITPLLTEKHDIENRGE